MAVQIPQRVLDGIFDRIDVRGPDECWPWKLSIGTHGYGQIGWGTKPARSHTTAHRAAWTAVNGPIPGDLTIDHLCRNRVCCNPAHLRLLTLSENAANNGQSLRSHCPAGHAYDDDNTYIAAGKWGPQRDCRACARDRRARNRDREIRRRRELSTASRPRPVASCATCGRSVAVGRNGLYAHVCAEAS